jgi:hypothetical protein
MNTQVYKKEGRKHVPIGYSDGWHGFPSDGVWIVQTKPGHKSSECIMKIGEIESMQPTINLILGYRDKIIKFLMDEANKDLIIYDKSIRDFVDKMLKEISK